MIGSRDLPLRAGLLAFAFLFFFAGNGEAAETGTVRVTEQTFEATVVQAATPVLVEFGAEWSGPNRQIGPIIDRLAQDFSGKLVVAKVDVDESPTLATKYAVRALPTLIIFSGGAPAAAHLGVMSEDALHTWVKETTGLTPGS